MVHEFLESSESDLGGWISVEDRLPELTDGCSENVLVYENKQVQVMCLSHMKDDDNNWCVVWCKVYDGLDGDGEFDDNYEPTHWMPLPKAPKLIQEQS
jgi:hypothetical protein